jgi:hypothetical protein
VIQKKNAAQTTQNSIVKLPKKKQMFLKERFIKIDMKLKETIEIWIPLK